MRLSLSENIGALRRAAGMTQERLAEALGVSFAAVSKWERGAATPELGLIADMAELFDVSIDALTGFELSGGQSETVSRLKARVHDRESGALEEAEAALRRWPNCFEIAYYAAENYDVRGISSGDAGLLRRALELYSRACRLIAQNRDPDISETTLYRAMAGVHISLGEPEKGIELLKAHNPCQLNDALIGKTLPADAAGPAAAARFAADAKMSGSSPNIWIATGCSFSPSVISSCVFL